MILCRDNYVYYGEREIGRKIIVFFILIVLTVTWSIFWIQHVKAYNEMVEDTTKNLPPEVVDTLDFKPLIIWKSGTVLSIALIVLAIFWLVLILSFFVRVNRKSMPLSISPMPMILCAQWH